MREPDHAMLDAMDRDNRRYDIRPFGLATGSIAGLDLVSGNTRPRRKVGTRAKVSRKSKAANQQRKKQSRQARRRKRKGGSS